MLGQNLFCVMAWAKIESQAEHWKRLSAVQIPIVKDHENRQDADAPIFYLTAPRGVMQSESEISVRKGWLRQCKKIPLRKTKAKLQLVYSSACPGRLFCFDLPCPAPNPRISRSY